jgi:hypothetical protein
LTSSLVSSTVTGSVFHGRYYPPFNLLTVCCSAAPAAVSDDKQQLLQEALAASRLLVAMPALADPLAVTAEETSLSNAFVCQPQQRNMHGRIFGGFLMRWVCTQSFQISNMLTAAALQCNQPHTGSVDIDQVKASVPVPAAAAVCTQSSRTATCSRLRLCSCVQEVAAPWQKGMQ